MNTRRSILTSGIALGAASVAPLVFSADTYPKRPIRLVLTLSAGGGLDVIARRLAEPLSEKLGQGVIVDNRPGAGGNLASAHVAKAPADGYTLLVTTDALVLNPLIYQNAGYQVQDLVAVSGVIRGPQVISVPAQSSYSYLKSLLNAAKAAPGTISYGSAVLGSQVIWLENC